MEGKDPRIPALPLRCRRVDWLAELLEMSRQQVYNSIAEGKIPPSLVLRIGRRIRIKEREALEWIAGGRLDADARECVASRPKVVELVHPLLKSPFPWAISKESNALPEVVLRG